MPAMLNPPKPQTPAMARNRGPYRMAGVTLVELMVVVLVGAILTGLAVPALRNLVTANQLLGLTDSFASAMNSARSEAAKLNTQVAFNPLPASAGTAWSGGWTMFVDSNANGALDNGETTLRLGAALPTGYTMNASGSIGGVMAFDGTGRLVGGAPGLIVFCQGGGPWGGGAARMITVTASGRVRIAQNDSTGQPLDDNGNAVTSCTP